MRSRYVVIADTLPVAKRDLVTQMLQRHGVGFWHWFPDAWLINDQSGRNMVWWAEQFRAILGQSAAFLFLEVLPGSQHHGYLTPEQWKWFTEPGNWP